jgi:hypothetical protein
MKNKLFVLLIFLLTIFCVSNIGNAIKVSVVENTNQCLTDCYTIYKIEGAKDFSDFDLYFKDARGLIVSENKDKLKSYGIAKKDNESYTKLDKTSLKTKSSKDVEYIKITGTKRFDENIDNIICIGKKCWEEFAWWNSSWQYKTNITLNSGVNTTLTDYPAYFKFNGSGLISQGKMKSDCSDIRVLNEYDNETLSFEIGPSTCNTTFSQVWVKIPNFIAGNNTIHFYYGNPDATDIQNIMDVWSNGYVSVYHGDSLSDRLNRNNLTMVGTASYISGASCPFGYCFNFTTAGTYLWNNVPVRLNIGTSPFSMSAWSFRSANPTVQEYLLSVGKSANNEGRFIGGNVVLGTNTMYGTLNGLILPKNTVDYFDRMNYYAMASSNDTCYAYFNSVSSNGSCSPNVNNNVIVIGAKQDRNAGTIWAKDGYTIIDEIRLSNVTRTKEWFNANYLQTYSPAVESVSDSCCSITFMKNIYAPLETAIAKIICNCSREANQPYTFNWINSSDNNILYSVNGTTPITKGTYFYEDFFIPVSYSNLTLITANMTIINERVYAQDNISVQGLPLNTILISNIMFDGGWMNLRSSFGAEVTDRAGLKLTNAKCFLNLFDNSGVYDLYEIESSSINGNINFNFYFDYLSFSEDTDYLIRFECFCQNNQTPLGCIDENGFSRDNLIGSEEYYVSTNQYITIHTLPEPITYANGTLVINKTFYSGDYVGSMLNFTNNFYSDLQLRYKTNLLDYYTQEVVYSETFPDTIERMGSWEESGGYEIPCGLYDGTFVYENIYDFYYQNTFVAEYIDYSDTFDIINICNLSEDNLTDIYLNVTLNPTINATINNTINFDPTTNVDVDLYPNINNEINVSQNITFNPNFTAQVNIPETNVTINNSFDLTALNGNIFLFIVVLIIFFLLIFAEIIKSPAIKFMGAVALVGISVLFYPLNTFIGIVFTGVGILLFIRAWWWK